MGSRYVCVNVGEISNDHIAKMVNTTAWQCWHHQTECANKEDHEGPKDVSLSQGLARSMVNRGPMNLKLEQKEVPIRASISSDNSYTNDLIGKTVLTVFFSKIDTHVRKVSSHVYYTDTMEFSEMN